MNNLKTKQTLSRAKLAAKKGDIQLATELYTAVLKSNPNDHTAKKGLRKLTSNASQVIDPPPDQLRDLLKLYSEGYTERTEKESAKLLRMFPRSPVLMNILGISLHALQKPEQAIRNYEKAIRIAPDYPDSYNNYGRVLHDVGRLDDAEKAYRQAIALKTGFFEAYNNLGNTLQLLQRYEEAMEQFERAIRINPDYASAYNGLGNVMQNLERFDDAIANYEKAIELQEDLAITYRSLLEVYNKLNRFSDLGAVLDRARSVLSDDNSHVRIYSAKLAYVEQRYIEARNILERIDLEDLELRSKLFCCDLLGKTYDRLEEYKRAFTQFRLTNEISGQSGENYKPYYERVLALTEAWSDASTPDWLEYTKGEDISPVFLVGFPRSGTTLLDTILRSHENIQVIEEEPTVYAMLDLLDDLPTPYTLQNLGIKRLADLEAAYFAELRKHVSLDESCHVVVDKLPLNIENTGLMHRVFPHARFIFVLRHPCDCVLSCYMQVFSANSAMANFTTLEQTARLYDAVMNLWEHYRNALDMQVCVVKYEELIQDLQGTVNPVLKFLDIEWSDSLLDYRQTALARGFIKTPSYDQVIQDIYQQASGRWERYREQMQDVLPLLEPWVQKFGYRM